MKTIRITLEIALKDYSPHSYYSPDFIYQGIEQVLETGEEILSYESEELIPSAQA